jgi:hypothetical protein
MRQNTYIGIESKLFKKIVMFYAQQCVRTFPVTLSNCQVLIPRALYKAVTVLVGKDWVYGIVFSDPQNVTNNLSVSVIIGLFKIHVMSSCVVLFTSERTRFTSP